MNEQNLRPINKMSPEEKRAFQSKGGKASARRQKEKRELREILEVVMATPSVTAGGKVRTDPATGKELNTKEAIATAISLKAASGDLKAARLVAEILGELDSKTELTGNLIIDCSES